MLDTPAALELEIPPKPQLSRVVRERVVEFARARHVGEDDLELFLTGLGEALANAIEHAKSSRPIRVECRITGDRITATVADKGIGFASVPIAPQLPDANAERGRGLALMRRCSDIFLVDTEPGRGTAIVLGRYRRDRSAALSA